jgi:hypothetical protein
MYCSVPGNLWSLEIAFIFWYFINVKPPSIVQWDDNLEITFEAVRSMSVMSHIGTALMETEFSETYEIWKSQDSPLLDIFFNMLKLSRWKAMDVGDLSIYISPFCLNCHFSFPFIEVCMLSILSFKFLLTVSQDNQACVPLAWKPCVPRLEAEWLHRNPEKGLPSDSPIGWGKRAQLEGRRWRCPALVYLWMFGSTTPFCSHPSLLQLSLPHSYSPPSFLVAPFSIPSFSPSSFLPFTK